MSGIIAKNASRSSGIIGPVAGSGGGTTNNSVDTMTGDGSDTTLALSVSPGSENNVQITFDGVTQHHSTFSLSGSTITFSTAPAVGVLVEAVSGTASTTGTPDDSTVATAKIVNNAVDETKLKDALIGDFTDATVTASDYFLHGDATDSGNTKKDTIQGVLDLVPSAGFTLATEQATTSGTGVTFGSIPTGTKIIIVSFIGVSTDSGANLYVKLGDSGGLESSGYLSTASRLETSVAISTNNATAAFCINNSATGHTIHGSMTLTLEDSSGFTWASTHSTFLLTTMSSSGGGTKSLSAELTQVQVLPASGNFDAGAVNISYL